MFEKIKYDMKILVGRAILDQSSILKVLIENLQNRLEYWNLHDIFDFLLHFTSNIF